MKLLLLPQHIYTYASLTTITTTTTSTHFPETHHQHDLLSTSARYGEGEALKIRESAATEAPWQNRKRKSRTRLQGSDEEGGGELYVAGLSQYRVASVEDVLQLLRHGAKARAVRATEYNEASSRSHAILQVGR